MTENSFATLLHAVKESCAWESIPDQAITALAKVCGPAEIAALIHELDALEDAALVDDAGDVADEYWRLRTSYSRTLAEIGSPAVEPLLHALESPNPETREYVALALGKIGDERALEPLLKMLAREAEPWSSIQALGDLCDERAVDALLPYLSIPVATQNRSWILRITAQALGKIGGERVIAALIGMLPTEQDWYARLGVVEGLAYLRDTRVDAALREAANDLDRRVSAKAREALNQRQIR